MQFELRILVHYRILAAIIRKNHGKGYTNIEEKSTFLLFFML